MKRLFACLFGLGAALGAAAEDTSRNDELVTSMDQATIEFVAESLGHSIRRPLEDGVGLLAVYTNEAREDELIYALQGKACGDDANCLGLEMFVIFNGTFDTEMANRLNQRWSAIKATITNDDLYLTRYLILDDGQTIGNIRTNLLNTLAIAELIDEESALAQAPAPAAEDLPKVVYGDDSGTYANDGACDDARFISTNEEWGYHRQHILKDASDCETLYLRGELTLHLEFGDNTGDLANNSVCDDPRFVGEGRSAVNLDAYTKKDAADCLAAYSIGTVNRS
ncbi:MAG: hypothetical protein AAFR51_17900 [Pseudomonadota bacterium]